MAIPAWAVSAAVLFNYPNGLDIEDLTHYVMETGLCKLGVKTTKVEPYKVLWTTLRHNCPHTDWFISPSPKKILLKKPDAAAENATVQKALQDITAKEHDDFPPLPEEIADNQQLTEGATKSIRVITYERNPKARKACIIHYGASCAACELDFAERYGELARGFIHVHHVKQLSTIKHDYVVDPIKDLRPICPNCHAVSHLGGRCRSIEEIKALLASARGDGDS